MPVLIVRVVMVVMVAIGGVGIAVYALAWTLVPVAPDSGAEAAAGGGAPGVADRAALACASRACTARLRG